MKKVTELLLNIFYVFNVIPTLVHSELMTLLVTNVHQLSGNMEITEKKLRIVDILKTIYSTSFSYIFSVAVRIMFSFIHKANTVCVARKLRGPQEKGKQLCFESG